MKLKVKLVFVIIILIYLIQAQNITLEYPPEVSVDEEFEIKVNLINFSGSMYDLKFDIKNGNKNLAHVYVDETWKSTHYWIKEAFVNEQERNFQLKITESYKGIVQLVVKIREGSRVDIFDGNLLTIINNETNENKEDENNENNQETTNQIELTWNEEDIIKGREFEIEIGGVNGNDVRLWIEKNNEILSERYDEKNEEWKSGLFYINDFNDEKITLRIKNEFSDFEGEAVIKAKIRNSEEHQQEIIILKNEDNENIQETVKEKSEVINDEDTKNSSEIIQLGTGKVIQEKTEKKLIENESSVIYESKTEKIKIYVLFGFALLCIVVSILIAWRKLE